MNENGQTHPPETPLLPWPNASSAIERLILTIQESDEEPGPVITAAHAISLIPELAELALNFIETRKINNRMMEILDAEEMDWASHILENLSQKSRDTLIQAIRKPANQD